MCSSPNIIGVATLIGDPSRMAILVHLLGGKSLPASELARNARITPQTASAHLAKLVEGGLIMGESHGRHRYYRLANVEVAAALEALQLIALPKPIRSLRESDQVKALHFARTCYDHLAGKVGVALTDRLLALEYLEAAGDKNFGLSEEGKKHLQSFGVDAEENTRGRRHFARQCLDWSERRYHVAGSLGASLTKRLFELGWIERRADNRAVTLTSAGVHGLYVEFGVELLAD